MSNLPTIKEIELLHRKYAKNEIAYKMVYKHSQIVAEISKQIIRNKNLNFDSNFIEAAALLHDIGAYTYISINGTFDTVKYIYHGIVGSNTLSKEGFDKTFCRICECHTGMGITKEDITKDNLPLPLNDYLAETVEERLIMYADKFHSKNPCFNSFSWYSNHIRKFGENKVIRFKQFAKEFGIPNVEILAEKYSIPLNQ